MQFSEAGLAIATEVGAGVATGTQAASTATRTLMVLSSFHENM
jgi:hypothetical protein